MKKILFLLLITVAGYGQTLQNPTFGTVKIMNSATVTTTPTLTTTETNGLQSKITPANLPVSTATQTAINSSFGSKDETKSFITLAGWGDSLTAGTGSTDPRYSYLGAFSKLTGYQYFNGGVGGETSTQIKDRMVANTATHIYPTIIWAGRNNYNSPTTVKADIATMVAALGHNNYIVLGIINGDFAAEYIGQSGHTAIVSLNNDLSAIYGSRFLDIRTHLVSLYNPSLPQDVIDHANDVPPTSLRFDQLHLNNAGNLAVANKELEYLSILEGDTKKSLDLRYAHDLFSSPGYIGSVLPNRAAFSDLDVTGSSLFTGDSHITSNLVVDGLLTASNSILNQPSLYIGSGLTSGWAFVNGSSSSIMRGYSSSVLKTEINPNGDSFFNGGNLTIGDTNSLGQKLRVNGTGYFEGKLTAHDTGVSSIPFDIGGGNNAGWIFQNGGSPTSRSIMKGYFNTTQSIQLDPVTFTYFNMTNFAIGTTTNSGFKLDVNGSTRLGSTITLGTIPATSTLGANILVHPTGGGNIEKLPFTTFAPNLLTGYVSGAGTVAGTDTVLQGIQKLNGNIGLKENSITAGTTSQYWRGDKTWQDLNSEISIQKIVDNTNRYGELDGGNSYIYTLLGSANNRIFKAKTGDATNSGEIYSSNNEVLLRGEISGVSTGIFQVLNGLTKITQTSASGTTTIGIIPATVNATINNPANSVAGTYIYQMQPKEYTVSTLPTPTGSDSRFAIVTDATAPTYLGALTGGGPVVCPVFYNGSAWVSH